MENRIRELLDERGIGPAVFAKMIDVPQTTISTIYNGRTKFEKIRVETFVKIAHGLGMSAEELWEMRDAEQSMTVDEAELVRLYRDTNEQGRAAIMAVARSQQGMERKLEARAVNDA